MTRSSYSHQSIVICSVSINLKLFLKNIPNLIVNLMNYLKLIKNPLKMSSFDIERLPNSVSYLSQWRLESDTHTDLLLCLHLKTVR